MQVSGLFRSPRRVSSGKHRIVAGIGKGSAPGLVSRILLFRESYQENVSILLVVVEVPAGTPKDIVLELNTEIIRILRMPDVRDRLSGLGMNVVGNSPEESAAFLKVRHRQVGRRYQARECEAASLVRCGGSANASVQRQSDGS